MDNQNINVEMHVVFGGRVQGIGFRFTVNSLASRLNLRGTVENLDDGTVELFSIGSKDRLENLLKSIQTAFPQSQVLQITFQQPTQEHTSFRIIG